MPSRGSGGGTISALILAAGEGKRMRSGRGKLLHPLCGSPMVCHVARAAAALRPEMLGAVVRATDGPVAEALASNAARSGTSGRLRFAVQREPLGTAHAVLQAERLFSLRPAPRARRCDLLVLSGDVPLIRPSTLRALVRHHRRRGAAVTVLTTTVSDPTGYGRVVRDPSGSIIRIVEQRDASAAQRRIREVNAGIYCADLSVLFGALRRTRRANAQKEYYLPDVIEILARSRKRVGVFHHDDAEEVLGVNNRAELARASKALYRRRAEELMVSGVTIVDPDCTYVEPGVRVGRDTVIGPMSHLEGRTVVGEGCSIGAFARIADSRLGDGVEVRDLCVIRESTVAAGAKIGPFAHLRPGTVLEEEVHVGNFVELKKSRLGRRSKANHLSYLGDADIGKGCNIGAGTITCNYDGVAKHLTTLEDEVFIGSDTQLVAPVTVRRGAYVGAGSTITKEVPEYSLALTRADLKVIRDWVKRKKQEREAAAKAASARGSKIQGRR